jgi:hypothetical protein
MKERLKKFWDDHEDKFLFYTAGLTGGLAIGLGFWHDAKNKQIEELRLYDHPEGEGKVLLVVEHKNHMTTHRSFKPPTRD